MKHLTWLVVLILAAPGIAWCRPAEAPIRSLHWAQFPVHVYFAASGPEQKEEAQTALAGFDEWVAASRGKISYVRVADPAKAEIIVHLVPKRYLSAEVKSVGETTVQFSGMVLKKAEVQLAEGAATPEDFKATAAHEFGHALGIQGHSEDPDDLMFPVEVNHFNAMDEPLTEAVHTVTGHDLQMLESCYPGLLDGAVKRP